MGFVIDVHARSRKGKGLFRKAPDPKEVGDRVGRLARRMLKDGVVRAGSKQDRYIVELKLHPAAAIVTLAVEPDGQISLRGDVSGLGPGYYAHLIERITPILDELDYVWTEPFTLAGAQTAMCAWLAEQLRGASQVRIGVPETRLFKVDAPVLTALGPRDAAWKAAVLADPAKAADAFVWWDTGPGREPLARALLSLALEVPWREPIDKEEREQMMEVDEDLRAARKADPALALPWPEWKELLLHLGIEDEDVNEKVGDRQPAIGYRRHDLEIELAGGWRVVIPGSFVGHWEEETARYWATDGDRMIEFSSFTANVDHDSSQLLAVAPEKYEVVERVVDGNRQGRAEAFVDNETPVVIGLMADAPNVGILTCKGGSRDWALSTWRSLQR